MNITVNNTVDQKVREIAAKKNVSINEATEMAVEAYYKMVFKSSNKTNKDK